MIRKAYFNVIDRDEGHIFLESPVPEGAAEEVDLILDDEVQLDDLENLADFSLLQRSVDNKTTLRIIRSGNMSWAEVEDKFENDGWVLVESGFQITNIWKSYTDYAKETSLDD